MSVTIPEVASLFFDRAMKFLLKYNWIYKSSNTEFISNEIFNEIPQIWLPYLLNLTNDQLNNLPFGKLNADCPNSLLDFFQDLNYLKSFFDASTNAVVSKQSIPIKIKGVNPKKVHEILKLSTEIHSQISELNEKVILIDLGCGLGYLSQQLFESYGYRILGLEADSDRVLAARHRQQKFFPNSLNSVYYESHYITDNSINFIEQIISQRFSINICETDLALIGLHSCADLSVIALRLYVKMKNTKFLSIMPCCYHKMIYSDDSRSSLLVSDFQNIPLSREMMYHDERQRTNWNSIIQRPFLRLASQQSVSMWKCMSMEKHVEHGENMFYRGIIQAVLNEDEYVQKIKPSSVKNTQRDNENDLIDNILNKFCLYNKNTKQEIIWTESHKEKLKIVVEKYKDGPKLCEILTGLQASIQMISEYIILMDRVCFVQEFANSLKVKLFNTFIKKITHEELSPRCFVLISNKT